MAPTYVRRHGSQTVTLVGYDRGMQRMIADPMMHKGLKPHAQAIKTRAEATAPRGRETDRRRAGRTESYAESFTLEPGIGRGTVSPGGGGKPTTHKRAYVRVQNDSRIAIYVEYGTSRMKARRTLRKAAGINRFDAKGDKYG